MKKIFYLIAMIALMQEYAQAQVPQAINYQTVVRNANGDIVGNQQVVLGFLIHDGAPLAPVVYWEVDTGHTNQFGLFTTAIGRGVVKGGSWAAINWSTGLKYLEADFYIPGDTTFLPMGTAELLSVPFALYAANGGNGATGPTGVTGANGATGANGTAGATGPTGAQGSQGNSGATGANGTNGTNGANGATGPTGANGNDGAPGATGPTGANGNDGAPGVPGPPGANGTNGADGATGATGPTGANGNNGVGVVSIANNTDSTAVVNLSNGIMDTITLPTAVGGGSNYWTPNGTAIYNNNSGNVGISIDTPSSTLHVNGSVAFHIAADSISTYTLGVNDYTVRRNVSGGGLATIVFPDATTCPGRMYMIICGYANTLTLTTVNDQTIYDDVTELSFPTLYSNSRLHVQSDGNNWVVIGYWTGGF